MHSRTVRSLRAMTGSHPRRLADERIDSLRVTDAEEKLRHIHAGEKDRLTAAQAYPAGDVAPEPRSPGCSCCGTPIGCIRSGIHATAVYRSVSTTQVGRRALEATRD